MILFRPIFGVKTPIFGSLPPNSMFLFHWGPSAPTPLISAPIYGVFWGLLGSNRSDLGSKLFLDPFRTPFLG